MKQMLAVVPMEVLTCDGVREQLTGPHCQLVTLQVSVSPTTSEWKRALALKTQRQLDESQYAIVCSPCTDYSIIHPVTRFLISARRAPPSPVF